MTEIMALNVICPSNTNESKGNFHPKTTPVLSSKLIVRSEAISIRYTGITIRLKCFIGSLPITRCLKQQGRGKIIGLLNKKDMTLTEIAKETSLTKPTVFHHLQKLQSQLGLVTHNKETGTYSIRISDELKKPILSTLTQNKTTEQIVDEIKKIGKEGQNKLLLSFVTAKDCRERLENILEVLYNEGLITIVEPLRLVGTKFERKEYWTLTWQGCDLLNICHYCRKPFDPNDRVSVAHTIRIKGSGTIYHAPLLHTTCVVRSQSDYLTYYADMEFHVDLCDYCGLPLSETVLREMIQKKNSLDLIYSLLTRTEIDALNIWKKNMLNQEFRKQFHISVPKNLFDGDVSKKSNFEFSINKQQAEQILKPDESGWRHAYPELESHEWEKGDYAMKFHAYGDAAFNFLREPNRADLERLFEFIVEGAKECKITVNNPEDRVREILHEWMEIMRLREKEIDDLISAILGDPRGLVYSKLWAAVPGPYDIKYTPYSRLDVEYYLGHTIVYGSWAEQESIGYSFIHIEDGKRYHVPCYQRVLETRSQLKLHEKDVEKVGRKAAQ